MQYSDIMSTIATIVSVIAIPATYLNGVRVGRNNDKRKEWNVISEPLISYFEDRKREHEQLNFYTRYEIPFEPIKSLRRRFTPKESERFERLFKKYIIISNKFTSSRSVTPENKDELCLEAGRLCEKILDVIKLK